MEKLNCNYFPNSCLESNFKFIEKVIDDVITKKRCVEHIFYTNKKKYNRNL